MNIQPGRNIVGVLATAFLSAIAQVSTGADAPNVAAILAQMQQASGGVAWKAVRTLHIVTSAAAGGETVARDHWEDLAAGRYRVSEARSTGATQNGFDGVTSWSQRRSGVAYALGDVDAALVAADESFRVARAWWFRDRHPATLALLGERSDGGRSFDVLSVTPEGGRPFEAWIDRSTHLLARTDEQQAEDRVVTTYGDYRSVQGLMLPFSIQTGDGEDPSFDEVETVRSVEVNPPVLDTLYAVPPLPVSDIQLPRGRDSVEAPFRLTADNRIMVPVTLNGHLTLDAEFDSGGSLLLQPGSAVKAGAASTGRHKQAGGGEGATTSTVGRLDTVAIGSARVFGLAFHSFAFHPDRPDEMLVGQEILQRFVVRIDFDRMVMTLTRPDAFHDADHAAVVPFHFQDNQPEVKGSVDGLAGLFTIDTGDNGSLLLIAPFARRYGLVARYRADIPYQGRSTGATHGVWARVRAGVVALDGPDGRPAAAVHDPVTYISLQQAGFDANRNVSANIGLGILKQFNLTFDYPRQRLILEPNHLFGQREVFNRTGLRLKRDGPDWTIITVYPDSPASAAGLVPGDRIAMIDGRTPDHLDEDALASRLKGPVGSPLVVQVLSGAGTRAVRLMLRDIL